MTPVIEVRNLTKQYRLGEQAGASESLRESIGKVFRNPLNGLRASPANRPKKTNSFFALNDVSLDVYKGDTIGVVGSNGAGKSTLLKIVSRITDPTSGHATIRGRVGSLLEVGTGFHPELSGRENIYLNGAILGMSKAEINANFRDIVSFAGISDFLDTPVKRYSSGMYVRLAFSIAAHLDPEILIVDEVLAVGDVAFQKKCLGKMAEACSRAKTVLFVSHNLAAVESLCNRVIVLQGGRAVFDGGTREGIQFYLNNVISEEAASHSHIVDLANAPGRSPKYQPHLTRLELFDGAGNTVHGDVPTGSSLRAYIYFTLDTACTSFDASLAFDTPGGQRVCTAHSAYEPDRLHREHRGEQVFVCEIPSLALVPGDYRLHVGLDIAGCEADWVDNAMAVTVLKADYYGTGIVPTKGAFLIQNRWKLNYDRMEVCL